jgi:hypothetical protein
MVPLAINLFKVAGDQMLRQCLPRHIPVCSRFDIQRFTAFLKTGHQIEPA